MVLDNKYTNRMFNPQAIHMQQVSDCLVRIIYTSSLLDDIL